MGISFNSKAEVGLYVLLSAFLISTRGQDTPSTWSPSHFDFIVVGAGSAGAVVAARLSEDSGTSVLLLEAGGHPTPKDTEIPMYAYSSVGTHQDWGYVTEHYPFCSQGFVDQRWEWPRGKVLGGSSIINGMVYTRGNRHNYDQWKAMGNEGWGYDDVLPYFQKMEDYQVPRRPEDDQFLGKGGPLKVSGASYRTQLADAFMQAGWELGHPVVDYNAKYSTGFMLPVYSMGNGTRSSTYTAYLKPAWKRPNLKTLTHAFVTKVTFDDNKRATGVNFESNGSKWWVGAKKEIILSGGVVNSPHLLMLSGIGDENQLAKFNIPVVSNLPGVGNNIKDHLGLNGLVFTLEVPISFGKGRYDTPENRELWETRRVGPLTVITNAEGIAFVHTRFANSSEDNPDMELVLFCDGHTSPSAAKDARSPMRVNIDENVYNAVLKTDEKKDQFMILPIYQNMKMKGHMKLRSADPHVPPTFHMPYMSEKEDVEGLLEGIKLSFALVETEAFQKFGTKYVAKVYPGCESQEYLSDDYWRCAMKYFSQGTYHQVGSCQMGPSDHSQSVVDSQLRVYGVDSLRVIDSSIMPTVTMGHTNGPAIMIGEKGADIIKKYWSQRKTDHEEL